MSKQEKPVIKKNKPVSQKQNSQTQQAKGKQTKATKSSAGDNNEDVKRDQKLQAIVFADNFMDVSIPFASKRLNKLHPIINIPSLDYTFEFLLQSGVEEVRLILLFTSFLLIIFVS
jgi:hypothetical protein